MTRLPGILLGTEKGWAVAAAAGLLLAGSLAWAQPPASPYPRIELRQQPAASQPAAPPVPFVLSPQETAQLDEVLNAWEQRNKEVKSFECDFIRWQYDAVFGNGKEPKTMDRGVIRYTAPDKGLFKIDGKDRKEQWICDGRAIYEYNYKEKKITEHRLSPELQGKAISDGPLPFVFGTEAHKLKQRYFLKVSTPPDAQGEAWLLAYPRYQRDAAEFHRAEVILKTNGMLPFAIQLFEPGGKTHTTYQLSNVVVNPRFRFLEGDWFHPSKPLFDLGWQTILDDVPASPAQASRVPLSGRQ